VCLAGRVGLVRPCTFLSLQAIAKRRAANYMHECEPQNAGFRTPEKLLETRRDTFHKYYDDTNDKYGKSDN